jgi:hypothetical protein
MDLPGRPASFVLLSVGFFFFALGGCSGRSGSQYESYDQLQKSTASQAPLVPMVGRPRADGSGPKPDGRPTERQPALPARKSADAKEATPSAAQTSTRARQRDLAVGSPARTGTANAKTDNTVTKSSSALATIQIASKQVADTKIGGPPSVAAANSTETSRKTQVLIPTKTFKPEGPEAAWRVSYNDIDLLKVLNMDPVTPEAPTLMPAWLKGLDGRRIRIRGFMYPTFQQTGIRAFALARDNQICCFGRNPKIYDVFDVMLRDGVTTNYLPNRPFDVVGVFHIRPEVEDGKLYRIYEMDDAVIVVR